MWRVVLRGITSHKRRLIGTCAAVVLGVAFLAGTLVLSDTMRASFDTIFASANAGTDAIIHGSQTIGQGPASQTRNVPETLVPTVRAAPDVADAEPLIQGIGQLSGSDGKPVGGDGPPAFAGNWINNASLNPYHIAEGRPPENPGEIVINSDAATAGKLTVGDKTALRFPDPLPVTIVGVVKFGAAGGLGGTTYAGLTFGEAQRYLASPGEVTSIVVDAKPGVSQDELVTSLKPLLPSGVEAITGTQLTSDLNQQINDEFLGFFTTFLLVFAVIAVIVASFSIYNTFAVIVTQRSRESALLRAVGASRSQIMRSITAESLTIGIIASAFGLGVGILMAIGLKALLDSAGTGLPPGGLKITPGTIITSLVVGIVVTLLASVMPAIRASRIPPLAALREIAIDRSGASRVRTWLGASVLLLGLLITASMATPSKELVLERAGVGACLTFVGFLIFSPVAALPVGTVLGAPIKWMRGVSGEMAQRNAKRNPKRTASTAAALVVGVCIVTLFTIFASSIKTSIEASVAGSFRGELVMSSDNFNGAGYSTKMITQIDELPQIADAASLAFGTVLLTDGKQMQLTVADPSKLGQVIGVPTTGQSISSLSGSQMASSQDEASANG